MPFLQTLSKLPIGRGNVKTGQQAGKKRCRTDPKKPNNRDESIFTSLADRSSGVLRRAWHITRTQVLLQTARPAARESAWAPANCNGKGFCFSCHWPEQTFTRCWPASFSGRGCPDSWVPHPSEVTCDCVISAAGRLRLCSRSSPWCPGHISSPPRSFAALEEDRCTSSVDHP